MGNIQEYKCPCCGGAIAFDSKLQKMKCPFCDTEFEMETLQGYDEQLKNEIPDDMNWELDSDHQWQEGENRSLRSYSCKSCGGEITGDETMAASSCPFCGNPIVLMDQFSSNMRPDYVIPFQLDKKAAKEGLLKHLAGKRLLPKIFKDQNHIDEIKGIYVPFWMFDADADASIRYRAEKIRKWSDDHYNYKETSYFLVHRGGKIGFENVPVDASSKMSNDLMESIEPFAFSSAVPFQTAYLAGYFADKYDVETEECIGRANERIKRSTETAFRNTLSDYEIVTPEKTSIQLQEGSAKYVLCPVWILNTTWNGEKYTFAMNGQTGKFVGNLPTDENAAKKWQLGLTAAAAAVTYAAAWILWMVGIL